MREIGYWLLINKGKTFNIIYIVEVVCLHLKKVHDGETYILLLMGYMYLTYQNTEMVM